MRKSDVFTPRPLSRTWKTLLTGVCFALVAGIGWLEEFSDGNLRGGVLYLAPVVIAAWFAGRRAGMAVAAVCTAVWVAADLALRAEDFWVIVLWNLPARGIVYFGAAHVFARLRKALLHEHETARRDFHTGAANAVFFYEILAIENERARRHGRPFTVAYMDLDNFKAVNDKFGHSAGDDCLRVVAKTLVKNIRGGDIAARIGGDEFAVLFPETGHEAVSSVVARMHESLLAAMKKRGWPVTFSIGVVTYQGVFLTLDEIIRKADAVMYSVKTGGKNDVRHAVFTADGEWAFRTAS